MAVARAATALAPPRYRLRADGPYPITGDFISLGIKVVDRDGSRLHTFGIVLSFEKQIELAHRWGLGINPSEYSPELIDALFRWGVRRVVAILSDGPPQWDAAVPTTRVVIESGDLADLARAWGPKTCDFQLRKPRRLICTAATPSDPTAITTDGLTTYAPTSESLCRDCALPDTDYLCSHLVNPEVTGIASDQESVVRRALIGAMCSRERPEIANPAACHAGGHPCWERIVEATDTAPPSSPLSLLAAIDYADAAWRASSISGRKHLFRHRSAEVLGDLTQPCVSRSDFRDRISELDTVMKAMEGPADGPSFTDQIRAAGPLVRLKHFIADHLEAHPANAAAAGDIRDACDRLLAINTIRTAIQHVEARDTDLSTSLAAFGIAYPVADWGEAWRRVEAAGVAALTRVAQTLADL